MASINRSKTSRSKLAFVVAAAFVIAGSGCYAHESAYVEAEVAPANVEVYPSTVYEGRVVYLIDNRWYVRDRGHWVYYRSEPEPLYRYRVHVERAPRAPHRHHHRHEHSREGRRYREAPAGYVAPRARRVD